MERFLDVNPGLSRRFQVRFTFADYSFAQLAAIFVKIAHRNQFSLARDCTVGAVSFPRRAAAGLPYKATQAASPRRA